jgi:hypothetical protein
MKTLPLYAAAAAALLSLAACDQKPEVVDTRAPDPNREALNKAAKVELPPAIAASVTFRCQPGNGLVYVDFYQGDKMVVVRTSKDGKRVSLNAPIAGEPYVAEGGYKLTGNAKAATVVTPDIGTKSCKA